MKFLFNIFIACMVVLLGVFAYYYNELRFEARSIVQDYHPKLATQILDRNGRLIANIFDEGGNRLYVKYDDIPGRVIEALVAIEDTSFFEHSGVNLEAIVRAGVKDIIAGKLVEGASTLTQQLVKNLVLTREKKFSRKLKEMILAIKIESELSKEQIIERYLNEIYFGHGYYGIRTAAQGYFHKSLDELSLKEIAMLVGLPKAPSDYDPTRHKDASLGRANRVLERMYSLGWINNDEYKISTQQDPIVYNDTLTLNAAPYVVDEVLKEMVRRYGYEDIRTGGYIIRTSIDLEVQNMARESLRWGYNEILKRNTRANRELLNGAMVVTKPQTGEVLALLGGVDYEKSSYNRATMSQRQPGSAFKPFIYQIALDSGYSLVSELDDLPVSYDSGDGKVYTPKNYSGGFSGKISLEDALVFSRNLPTVNMTNALGIENVASDLESFGFKNIPAVLSVSLGSFGISVIDLAKMYSMFANEGRIIVPNLIHSIEAANGSVIATSSPDIYEADLPEQSFLMISMLQDVVKRGTGKAARVPDIEVAGKTGTSNNSVDAWFCGFTPDTEVVIWYGNDDNSPMRKVESGGRTAAPVFADFMKKYLVRYPDIKREFVRPEGVYVGKYDGKEVFYTDLSRLPTKQKSLNDEIERENNENGLIF